MPELGLHIVRRQTGCTLEGGFERGAAANAHQDFAAYRGTIPLQHIVNHRASQCISANLIVLATRKQTIEFAKICAGAGYQLVEELSLVSESPLSLGRHGKSLVKPARDRLTAGSTPDQDVGDFMAQHIFEAIVGIAW